VSAGIQEIQKPEHFRLFVAITLPAEVKSRIEAAQRELRPDLPEKGVSWTRPEQFHLTLRFLGNVEVARFEALRAALSNACANIEPLSLRAAGIGFFPRARAPRVVWVGISDQEDRLPALHAAVQSATDDFTAEKSQEKFTGHVTLGRFKNIQPNAARILVEQGRGMEPIVFGDWIANEIEIIRSQLSPQGARHTALATVAFRVRL
jgi:2'-5' RNA ligase